MKKVFLFAGLASVGFSAMAAEVPAPTHLEDAFIYALSTNGNYAVSTGVFGIKIFNLTNGHVDEYLDETGTVPSCGIGNCVSDNGIVVGTTDDTNAQYWKDGVWYNLEVPAKAHPGCLSNAITPDGSRICGSIAVSEISFDRDVLMQTPVIWNATADGYGVAVELPYPDRDFTGRVPQYVMATDISADGKTVIGQVVNATGMISYPIIYKEGADGKWSYEIVNEDKLIPEGLAFPEYPGDSPAQPQAEQYMNEEELAAFQQAYEEWVLSGYMLEYPDPVNFLSPEKKAEYDAAMEVYKEEYAQWETDFNAWFEIFDACLERTPNFIFNSMKISPDGKYFGGTVEVADPSDPYGMAMYNVWVGDVATGEYTKYNQNADLNLTYLANDGVTLASTSVNTPSNSFVLKNGQCETMFYWMAKQCIEYAAFMQDNMTREIEITDWNTGEVTTSNELMSGRAVGTPNLETVALTMQNIWDYMTDGEAFVFPVEAGHIAGVKDINVDNNEEQVIYDLAGRRLNNVVAPGIYIVNGEKKVIR